MSKYYLCGGCGREFDEYETLETYYEVYYGLSTPSRTPLTLAVCPHCDSEDIMEYRRDEEDEF